MSSPAKRQPRALLPLVQTSALLADLCRRVEEGEALSPMFVQMFKATKLQHRDALTEVTTFADLLLYMVNGAKGARDRWAEKARKFEEAQEAFKEAAKQAIKDNPDLPWIDSYGTKVYVSRNSSASLQMNLSLDDKTVRNVVDYGDVTRLGPYVKTVTYLVIDTDKVREDLAAGVEISWAKLERGDHVRGLNGNEPADIDAAPNEPSQG